MVLRLLITCTGSNCVDWGGEFKQRDAEIGPHLTPHTSHGAPTRMSSDRPISALSLYNRSPVELMEERAVKGRYMYSHPSTYTPAPCFRPAL